MCAFGAAHGKVARTMCRKLLKEQRLGMYHGWAITITMSNTMKKGVHVSKTRRIVIVSVLYSSTREKENELDAGSNTEGNLSLDSHAQRSLVVEVAAETG